MTRLVALLLLSVFVLSIVQAQRYEDLEVRRPMGWNLDGYDGYLLPFLAEKKSMPEKLRTVKSRFNQHVRDTLFG